MREELRAYEVEAQEFWESLHFQGYDGYDIMGIVEQWGWKAISGWGKDGWDLGSWPYVVVYSYKHHDDTYELTLYVEGDMTAYRCPTKEIRNQIIDEIAFFYWQHDSGADWIDGYRECESADQLPPELRGPYRQA